MCHLRNQIKYYCITFLFLSAVFLHQSCKKTDFETQNVDEIKFETTKWFQKIQNSLTDIDYKNLKIKIDFLDYKNSKKIIAGNSGKVTYVIKINETNNKEDEFLAFEKLNEKFNNIGFLKVFENSFETEIKNITTYFETQTLETNFRLSIYFLNEKHNASFEGLKNNGLKKLVVVNGENFNINKKSSLIENLDGCTDWYMVTTYTYADGTQTQTWEYLTTTCANGSCSISDPYNINDACLPPDDGSGNTITVVEPDDNINAVANICKSSFRFHNFVSPVGNIGGWQVAGTQGIHMNIVDLTTGQLVPVIMPTMYFGMPIYRNGVYISPSLAAEYTAAAVEYAENQTMHFYHSNYVPGSIFSIININLKFREKMNQFMQSEYSGSAMLIPGSNINVTDLGTASYSWPILGCL